MPKGGRRPGAGRPPGARDKFPRRRRFSPETLERAGDLLNWLDKADAEGRPAAWLSAIEQRGLSGDVECLKWLSAYHSSYKHGLPAKRAEETDQNRAFREIVREAGEAARRIREERRNEPEEARSRASTPEPLISVPSRLISAGSEDARPASEPTAPRDGAEAGPATVPPSPPDGAPPAPDPVELAVEQARALWRLRHRPGTAR